ncbi:MAG: galactose-1-phosphate uridylyltransferase [Acidobacteriota bacterium]
MSLFRKDPLSNGWVIVSPERGLRPSDFGSVESTKKGGFCPFCPGNEGYTPPEILAFRQEGSQANRDGWWVRTIPNKFAYLSSEGELRRKGKGIYDLMNGVGAHEIIVEAADHNANFTTIDAHQTEEIIKMHLYRMLDLRKDGRFRYVQIFKNHGSAAGAALEHAHSQIIALPITPRWLKEELNSCALHYAQKERCLLCDIMSQETEDADRIVFENSDFVAFEPFASKFPFETWILPKQHSANFHTISEEQIVSFADCVRTTLSMLFRALQDPPYNFVLHTAPVYYKKGNYWKTIDEDYHWHMEIIPRLTKMAGFEWGTGFYINPTPPEEAARYLRDSAV